jgi:hypothetical protein
MMTDTTQDKIGYVGARLREKSTYGGLAVAVGMLLPLLTKYFPQLAGTSVGTIVEALSSIGIGVGLFIGIFLPEKGNVGVASATKTVVNVLLVAFALSAFLAVGRSEAAQLRRPAVTGDIVKDIQTDLSNSGIKVPTVTPVAGGNLNQCDFNIFAALNPQNVVSQIQSCVSAVNNQFLPDVKAALDSATAYGDDTGVQCLRPALAIVQAAVGTPAVAASPEVPATATTPEIPAVAAVPAQMPGIILIFQKFREFTLAGGPTACQNWVKTTVNGVNPL